MAKTLRDVMGGKLQLIIVDDGYELSSAAGVARYDRWGVRTTVHGIPEYFPVTLAVKDKSHEVAQEPATGGFPCAAALAANSKQTALTKELQDYIKLEVKTTIDRELQPGGKIWRL